MFSLDEDDGKSWRWRLLQGTNAWILKSPTRAKMAKTVAKELTADEVMIAYKDWCAYNI
jgi:hypothetical protein